MLNRFLYKSYRFFYTVNTLISSRFTGVGRLILIGIAVSAVIGLDTEKALAYQIFAFLVSLVSISMIWSLFAKGNFTVIRKLPKFGTVGETLFYIIEIQNTTLKKQNYLSLIENLTDPRPTIDELVNTPEPDEEKRNIWDRRTLYFRWLWLISKNRKAHVKETPLPNIPPNGKIELRANLLPLQRGELEITGVNFLYPDPLGIFKSFINVPVRQSLLILPKQYQINPIDLPGSRKYQPGGVAFASSIGNSDEFLSVRDYRPGDPLRQIHWKSWAKTGKPIIKEYMDEYFVRHALILDTFLNVAYSNVFEAAVSVAASVIGNIQTQESLIDLMFVGAKAYCFSSGRNTSNTDKMMEVLASVKICQDKPFSTLSLPVFEHSSVLSGCIIILLMWDKERQNFISHLKKMGLPVFVIVIMENNLTHALDLGPMADSTEKFHIINPNNIKEGLAKL
ncbi:MAG: DUF58 domain-containing protein [Desulfobacterales bacterium]|nr:DUF58 domain-containing protein [Desulfobacterales bacterium]